MKVAVIGAGPWGTTVACLLKQNNHEVSLWAFQNILDKDIKPDKGIEVTDDINKATEDSEYIFVVLNSQFFTSTLDQIEDLEDKKFIILTKGFVNIDGKYLLPADALEKKYNIQKENIAALAGPNIAGEIHNKSPAAALVASTNLELAEKVKVLVESDLFKIHLSDDVNGLELAGILKNPVAIACGISDTLFNEASNPKSAIISKAVEEMQSIGTLFNTNPKTFTGIAGIGDLITTCFSGRNRTVGIMLAEGKSLDQIKEEFKPQLPEGADQIKIIHNLIKGKVKAALFEQLYKIVYEKQDVETLFSVI